MPRLVVFEAPKSRFPDQSAAVCGSPTLPFLRCAISKSCEGTQAPSPRQPVWLALGCSALRDRGGTDAAHRAQRECAPATIRSCWSTALVRHYWRSDGSQAPDSPFRILFGPLDCAQCATASASRSAACSQPSARLLIPQPAVIGSATLRLQRFRPRTPFAWPAIAGLAAR